MTGPAAGEPEAEPVAAARLVLGTAGHIDHGKTALALALTGHDTDRLPAEKARGISIELGFAPLDLPSGRALSLVDVPGHERFVRHMVAGASGVDGFLLCVAADDGVMPQTIEHMAVLRLLGVRDGVVALTKADLADDDTLALVEEEARELAGEGVEIVPVCAPRGDGLPELVAALERLAGRLARRTAGARARLFVDRAFSIVGAGTVVTGTLWGGPLTIGERVLALPGGAGARLRSIEVHDRPVAAAASGRVALNLAGAEREDVPRGSCIVRAGDGWETTDLLDVDLQWLPDAPGPLRTRRRLQAFLGTAELSATCVLLEGEALAPGERAYAQLRLERPVTAEAGDRLVLRSAERRTVGGALVVDPSPRRHGRGARAAARLHVLQRGDPVEVAALRLREAGGRGLDPAREDAAALRAAGAVLPEGGPALDAEVAAGARDAILAALAGGSLPVAAALAASGLAPPAAEALVSSLEREGALVREGARLRPAGAVEADPAAAGLAAMLAEAGIAPPTTGELGRRAGLPEPALRRSLARLRETGAIVQGGDLWFDAAAAAAARARAAEALAGGPMTIAELRDLWGVGRKHALALAAHLDASGLTRRVGDRRTLRRGAA
jgi:selenocysteine-specific elongation factor